MSSKQKEISMENGSDLEEYSIEEVLLKRGQVHYAHCIRYIWLL